MSRYGIMALLGVLAIGACADTGGEMDEAEMDGAAGEMSADPDVAPAGEATGLPEGYELRLDRANANRAEFQAMSMDGGLHVQTGPAGILYSQQDAVESGDYSVSASFTEIGTPEGHREAFGLFIGGADLQGEAQRYTYFLVRADGSYLIKRREGGDTSNVTDGWVRSDAVNTPPSGGGDFTNDLAIQVSGDEVTFLVNGNAVETVPADEVDARGVAGVRINHNLEVMVNDFNVTG